MIQYGTFPGNSRKLVEDQFFFDPTVPLYTIDWIYNLWSLRDFTGKVEMEIQMTNPLKSWEMVLKTTSQNIFELFQYLTEAHEIGFLRKNIENHATSIIKFALFHVYFFPIFSHN